MKRFSFILILAFLPLLSAKAADPFAMGRLFVSPSMKANYGRTIGVGMNFTIAPVRMAQKKLLNEFKKNNPDDYQLMLEVAQYVDPSDIEGMTTKELKTELKSIPQLSGDQKSAIDNVPDDTNKDIATGLVKIMKNPDTAVSFSMEPFVELHFDSMDVIAIVPIAGFDGDTLDFAMGNIGVDLRFGHHFGKGVVGGLSYGVQLWAPTGTEKANALGLANLMWSTRYFHEYMTTAPYLILGLDLPVVTLQASCLYNAMVAVRDTPDFGDVHFLQYGGAISVDLFIMTLVAEITGLTGIRNAPAYNSLVLTGGLRFTTSVLDLGLAAQVPLVQESGSSFASFSSVSFGNPSDFNMILTGSFGF